MKKYLIIAIAALVAFTACKKEVVYTPIDKTDNVVLTFTSERPQLEPQTKTAWDETNKCIVWESTDKIRVGYTLNGNWMGQTEAGTAKFYVSKEVTIVDNSDSSVGTFKVPITGDGVTAFTDPAVNGTYTFYSVYPSTILTNTTVNDPTAQSVTLATAQAPGVNTFDQATDIMVGASKGMTISGLPTDPIALNWKRVVAHVDLTFSNMAFDGTETPNKITLTFNEDAKVAGTFSVNIADGTIGAGSSNVIVLEGSGLTVAGSNIKAWATVLPVSFSSLQVEVKTDKATYVREIASFTGGEKTFKKNARNTLTINMATAGRVANQQYDWVKKDLSAITSSDVFVIVGNNGDNYAMNHHVLNSKGAPTASEVAVSNNKLTTVPSEALQWTLSSDSNGYMFYPSEDNTKWLNLTADNNGLRVNNTAANGKYWSLDSDYLKGTDTKGDTRYIGVYQSTDWRSYTSNGGNIEDQTIAFYVRSAATPSKPVPTISFGEPTTEVNIGATVDNAATITPSTLEISYSSSNEGIATVSDAGVVTGVAAGTATITASFAGNETYDAASAEYEITVVDPNANDGSASKPYTASEAIAKAKTLGSSTIENVYVKGIVSRTGSVNTTYNSVTYYISDDGSDTNQFEVYSGLYLDGADFTDANNVKLGDYVVVCGTLKYYSNYNQAEFDYNSQIKDILRAPTFNPDGGSFTEVPQSVAISAESGTEIRYTTGETLPTSTTGTVYSGAISITETTTINAIAVKDGKATGVVSKTFTKKSGGDSTPFTYNLTPASGSNNGYANNCDIVINGITWNLTGNSTFQPWRIGGKSLSSVDRTLYSKTAMAADISKIVVTHGSANSITVNSMTLVVSKNADFSNPISTLTQEFTANSSMTINRPDNVEWKDCYYKFVYNVTVSGTSNKFLEFTSAVFTGTN